MAGKNFHRKPFDQHTLIKLELFRLYVRDWLAVFTSPKYENATITIVDFFAGPGRDVDGREGSPLLILREIRAYAKEIRRNGISVKLELNEAAKSKARLLRRTMEAQGVPPDLCEWNVRSDRFEDAFDELYPELLRGNNLFFLDQQGVRYISDDVLRKIVLLPRTVGSHQDGFGQVGFAQGGATQISAARVGIFWVEFGSFYIDYPLIVLRKHLVKRFHIELLAFKWSFALGRFLRLRNQ